MKRNQADETPRKADARGILPFAGTWPRALLVTALVVGRSAERLRTLGAWMRLQAFRAAADRTPNTIRPVWAPVIIAAVFVAARAWAQTPMDEVNTQVTEVACTVIKLVEGFAGKALAFAFLAGGAVAAFAGKWGYVAGGMGGGLILMLGPAVIQAAFVTAQTCP
ncbi:MAG: hypothetical protein HYY13_13635 [Nitrospirae bacterium]|nr:hypothetical protein [Nitrospirota bacterium]